MTSDVFDERNPHARHHRRIDRHEGIAEPAQLLAAGAGAAALGLAAMPSARATARATADGLPVLHPTDDWQAVLARTPQVQLEPGATYVLHRTVALPSGALIAGNGATVTVASDSVTAFSASEVSDVTIDGVRLLGRVTDPINTEPVFDHVGIRLTRCTDVRVVGCDFSHWRGAGVVLTGSARDDYFEYRCKVIENTFYRCYFGVSIADRAEYGILHGNSFATCRLAIWNSCGNWTINDNNVVLCYGAYYSIARTSPYGALLSDNWNHGSVVGNTFNHSTSGASGQWKTGAAFPVGGTTEDPGSGVVVRGLLPPTFTGNTLWYTDVAATDLVGTRWLLSGSTFSNPSISCTGPVPVHLVGTQANGAGNLPKLVGNVKDLLAGLG